MKKTLSTNDVIEALLKDEYAKWTRWEAMALAEYFEEYEEDTGEDIELDTVAIRCEFSAWASLHDWAEQFFLEEDLDQLVEGAETEEDEEEILRDYVLERGTLIERQIEGGIKGIMRSVVIVSEF